jgi:NhaP-type Na+/H+ or K+/H+ antiporter
VTPYILGLIAFGALVLLTAWMPMLLREAPLSLPIVCVGIGAAAFALPHDWGGLLRPDDHLTLVEHVTELLVIISLMGAGLKLDRPLGWRAWRVTWRLLGVAMPLGILAFAVLAEALLDVGWAAALLLAAALAPTDPVLASDVQVGPPNSGEERESRFALTSEAGLNDALAFPFVYAALGLAAAAEAGESWFARWLLVELIWKLAAGLAVGLAVGRALAWLLFRIPARAKLSRSGDGFVALGITLIVYGLAELAHGYGFLAVFVAALAVRAAERSHEYHSRLHDFAEQLERLFMMALLVGFGGALTGGGLLVGLTWGGVAFAAAAVFVVRPLTAWLGLAGTRLPADERAVIAFYGIRGVGSVYYLAFGLGYGLFPAPGELWATLGFTVLLSVLLHGVTVTPAMRALDRRREPKRGNGGFAP